MNSVWTEMTSAPRFDTLKEDIKVDVLVIGGGLAGLLCAYSLEKAGVDYALVEKNVICGGVTKNTTAKITAQHGLIYQDLIKKFGCEKANAYLRANLAAVEKYHTLCKTIDCDFEEKPSYVYSLDSLKKVENEVVALEKIGYSAKFVSNLPLPFSVTGAVCFESQAQFHPLKFAYAIARELRIYEHTEVIKLEPQTAITRGGKITAKKIIVATHFPFLNTHGFYFLKLYQHRSYVLALKNAPTLDGTYVDAAQKGMSFRSYGDLLFLGGGDHRTGEQGGNWQELSEFKEKYYPNAETAYRWATQDCMSLDGVPYIGQYSLGAPDIYVATGFNKWGVTSSMVAADILTDLVQDKKNEYAFAFSPSRTILRKQLAINAGKAIVHLVTPTAPRCPHMGCALKYNKQEHSWDCPCHGSRFSGEGEILNNPATKNLESGVIKKE